MKNQKIIFRIRFSDDWDNCLEFFFGKQTRETVAKIFDDEAYGNRNNHLRLKKIYPNIELFIEDR